jgi:spore germination cell wall hydrolase CwlJ-like protein
VLARASDPPYDFMVVGVIKQGANRGYDECALTPAEAMVLAPHTFDIEASGDRSTRRQ